MKVLDLFCGGGGSAEGYLRAGWEVHGVDKRRQRGYPGSFTQGDAIEFLREHGHEYDLIHASPPCQGYSGATRFRSTLTPRQRRRVLEENAGREEPQLIDATRAWLKAIHKPYVIENVERAKWALNQPITLCGGMFNLYIRRHRAFEVSPRIPDPSPGHTCPDLKANAELLGLELKELSIVGSGRSAGQRDRWIPLLDIRLNTGMSRYQTKEAIPPVYTHFIAECFKEMGL